MRFSKNSSNPISSTSPSALLRSATIATTTSSPTTHWRQLRSATKPTRNSWTAFRPSTPPASATRTSSRATYGARPPATNHRLQPERLRDADQPAERHSHQPRGHAERHAVHDGKAVRGLHRSAAPDSAGVEPDRGSAARWHERPPHAGTLPAGEDSHAG